MTRDRSFKRRVRRRMRETGESYTAALEHERRTRPGGPVPAPAVERRRAVASRLNGTTLYVANLHMTADFYREVLGVQFASEDHDGGPLHYHASWGEWPSTHVMLTLWPAEAGTTVTPQELSFTCDDMEATHERAKARGATIVHTPVPETEVEPPACAFLDPAGNKVTVYSSTWASAGSSPVRSRQK